MGNFFADVNMDNILIQISRLITECNMSNKGWLTLAVTLIRILAFMIHLPGVEIV